MKGNVVTNTVTIVGIFAIGALMFTKVPGMVDDIQTVLSKTSVIEKAAEISDMLTLSSSSPGDIKIVYTLVPKDIPYTVFIKDGYVNVSTGDEWAVSRTTSNLCFMSDSEECRPEQVRKLMITKTSLEKVE